MFVPVCGDAVVHAHLTGKRYMAYVTFTRVVSAWCDPSVTPKHDWGA
jgi:hypothetical protein